MKRWIGLILLGLLCYYGVRYSRHMNSGVTIVSPPLVTIVDEWKSTMNQRHIPIAPFKRIRKIVIVDDSVVDFDYGYCNKQLQLIYISKSTVMKGYWSTKAAVWHELGHFIYELDHVDGFNLMNAEAYTEEEYKENWKTLEQDYLKLCKEYEGRARY